MLKSFFDRFRKKDFSEQEIPKEIELSKIDKHMNFILRDRLGNMNRQINDKIVEAGDKKDEIIHLLRNLHKSQLMNPNISQREIQIMEGNRENYIKRISHFIAAMDIPKNYLETYDYCVKFSQEIESLFKDVQKNIFILSNFFENEIKTINKEISRLESILIDIRITFEKNNIDVLKNIQDNIKKVTGDMIRIKTIEARISEHDAIIKEHEDKLKKLNERIGTITSGTDFRALESFKKEKLDIEDELKGRYSEFDRYFSEIDTALKKYYYKNPDKKILKGYLDDSRATFLSDENLELCQLLSEMKDLINTGQIDLKDKKKDTTLSAIGIMTMECAKNLQSDIRKLDDSRKHIQTKITHNSASLNLSEQQYWMSATESKVNEQKSEIAKLKRDIDKVNSEISELKVRIQEDLEKALGEKILITDDLAEQLENPGQEDDKEDNNHSR